MSSKHEQERVRKVIETLKGRTKHIDCGHCGEYIESVTHKDFMSDNFKEFCATSCEQDYYEQADIDAKEAAADAAYEQSREAQWE